MTQLSGIQYQLIGASATTVANNANVLFNSLINNTTNSGIIYNEPTGTFTITQPGNYYVSWWVNTDGAEASTTVQFSVVVNGTSVAASSPAPIVTTQLNGTALITVTNVPVTLSLVNTTGAPVTYGTSTIQANIVIMRAGLL